MTDQLIEIEAEHNGCRLWGYAAHPSQSKGTRKGQYLFLNGRWIQDRSLQHALGEAYRGLLMVGRYPQAFLFLEVPADEVDVNVHPTKAEVRFRDAQQLYRLMLSTLRNRFLGMDLDSKLSTRERRWRNRKRSTRQRQAQVQRELVSWARDELANWQPREDVEWRRTAGDSDREGGFAVEEAFGREATIDSNHADGLPDFDLPVPANQPSDGGIVHVSTPQAEASADVGSGRTASDAGA